MFRSRYFNLMEVVFIRGKRAGFIKEPLIDFHKKKIIGFKLSSYDFIQKSINVMKEDIVSFQENMVIKNTSRGEHLSFKELKGMDIIDIKGNMIGMLEDFIFFENSFIIVAAVVSSGLISNYTHGKRVLLMEELQLGDRNILWIKSSENIKFTSMPHKVLGKEGGCH